MVYVAHFAGDKDNGREQRDGEERRVVQSAVIRPSFFSVAAVIALSSARGVTGQHVSLWHEIREQVAVSAQQ